MDNVFRTGIVASLLLMGWVGATACDQDLRVEQRQFACQDSKDCLDGWVCSADGACERSGADAAVSSDADDTSVPSDTQPADTQPADATGDAPSDADSPDADSPDADSGPRDGGQDTTDAADSCTDRGCPPELVCDTDSGQCITPPECDGFNCTADEQCVLDGDDNPFCCEPVGVPAGQCDPYCQIGCDAGEACRAQYNEEGDAVTGWVCEPAGSYTTAELCSPGEEECEAGLTCGLSATFNNECQPFCRLDAEDGCTNGRECTDSFGYGVVGACTPDVL